MQFISRALYAVHVQSPLLEAPCMVEHLATMLARLANVHGGTLEPVSAAGALVTFANPRNSLRLALGLQRGDPRLRLQIDWRADRPSRRPFLPSATNTASSSARWSC